MNHNIFVLLFIMLEIITIAAIVIKKIKSQIVIFVPYCVTIIFAVLVYVIKDTVLIKSIAKNDVLWLFSNMTNLAFIMALLSTPLTFISMRIISKYRS